MGDGSGLSAKGRSRWEQFLQQGQHRVGTLKMSNRFLVEANSIVIVIQLVFIHFYLNYNIFTVQSNRKAV